MKKLKSLSAFMAIAAILIPFSLSSCNKETADTKPNSSESTLQENTQNIELDSYEEQIAYYMALSESLKEELLTLKEESYVESCEKDLKIAELEKTVSALQKTILAMTDPESGMQDNDKENPSLDQIVLKQDFELTVSGEEIIITKYVGNGTEVVVPTEINGLPVREIADGAFKNSDISSVTLPSTLRKIGWFAFEGCTQLESVYIHPSVTSIGHGAFNSCPSSMKIICESGSYAETYAQSWGLGITLK